MKNKLPKTEAPKTETLTPEVQEVLVAEPAPEVQEVVAETLAVDEEPKVELSPMALAVVDTFKDFSVAMSDNTASTPAIVRTRHQALYSSFNLLLNKITGKDFVEALNAILVIIHEGSKDAYHPKKIFRQVGELRVKPDRLSQWTVTLTALLSVADPVGRKNALRHIDLTELAAGYPEDVKQKLASYFNK